METKDLAALLLWGAIGIVFVIKTNQWGKEQEADRQQRMRDFERTSAKFRERAETRRKSQQEIEDVLADWNVDWAKDTRPSWAHLTLAQRRAAIKYPEEAYAEIDRGIDANALYQRNWEEFNRKPRCYLCGRVMHLRDILNSEQHAHLDHIVPLSKGGTHTWANVALTHGLCNQKKGTKATKMRVGHRASLPASRTSKDDEAIRKRPRIRKNRLGQTWGIEKSTRNMNGFFS
jgi:5-methylcytosine-specific restriction endonuclease McrA